MTTKRVILILSLAAFVASLIYSPTGAQAAEKVAKGNEAKGRYYFIQNCKTCHSKGGKGGEVTPLTKTQAQWKAYFTAGKHAKGSEQLSKILNADQIRDAQTFLVAHAVDSPQPETCGK